MNDLLAGAPSAPLSGGADFGRVDLISGRTGFSEWSQQVDHPLGDMFAFESEIARDVSNALSVQMATDAPAPGGLRSWSL